MKVKRNERRNFWTGKSICVKQKQRARLPNILQMNMFDSGGNFKKNSNSSRKLPAGAALFLPRIWAQRCRTAAGVCWNRLLLSSCPSSYGSPPFLMNGENDFSNLFI